MFIPDSVKEWYRVYHFYQDFPGASIGKMQDLSARFVDAWTYYDSCYKEFQKDLTARGSK